MTRNEVIEKWNKNHHAALSYLLALTDAAEKVVYVPISNYRMLVTTQILKDLGYRHTGKFHQKGLFRKVHIFHRYVKVEAET